MSIKAAPKQVDRAYAAISDEVRILLHNDLRRQESFEVAKSIQFDFGDNSITVDGESYFSASSRVILKSSFFAGFLGAATKQEFFRHPRFCIIDTIEDKGMEPARSHNFQLQIARIREEALADHQVIFATDDCSRFGRASIYRRKVFDPGRSYSRLDRVRADTAPLLLKRYHFVHKRLVAFFTSQ